MAIQLPGWCKPNRSGRAVLVFIGVLGFLPGCVTDATTDLTKAPFDASTELTDATTGSITKLTDGTSQATTDLTEPTREFLSSTTPGAWFNGDGTLNPDHAVVAFVVLNFDNLQQNMAQGHGEYLTSLARLAGMPQESYASFCEVMQSRYGYIYNAGHSPPESVRRLVSNLPPIGFHS